MYFCALKYIILHKIIYRLITTALKYDKVIFKLLFLNDLGYLCSPSISFCFEALKFTLLKPQLV